MKTPTFYKIIDHIAITCHFPAKIVEALHTARQFRNQIHFYSVSEPEWNRYGLDDYNRSIRTLQELLLYLTKHYADQAE